MWCHSPSAFYTAKKKDIPFFPGFSGVLFGWFGSVFCLQIGQETLGKGTKMCREGSPGGSDRWLFRGPQKKEKRMHKSRLELVLGGLVVLGAVFASKLPPVDCKNNRKIDGKLLGYGVKFP